MLSLNNLCLPRRGDICSSDLFHKPARQFPRTDLRLFSFALPLRLQRLHSLRMHLNRVSLTLPTLQRGDSRTQGDLRFFGLRVGIPPKCRSVDMGLRSRAVRAALTLSDARA